MPSSKKPRKPYRPKWNVGQLTLRSEPWKIAAVFAPVEAILDGLDADGTIATNDDGLPLFNDAIEGCHYAMGPSLRGLTDAFDLHAERHKRPNMTAGLLSLIAKLEGSAELERADIEAARESVRRMRAEAASMASSYATKLVRDVQIKFELEALAPVAQASEYREAA